MKTCLFCKHFRFEPGDNDYYDGLSRAYVECRRGKWDIDMHEPDYTSDTRGVFIKAIEKANSCDEYEFDKTLAQEVFPKSS